MWKIPETSTLLEQRKEIDADRWLIEGDETVGTENSRHCVVMTVYRYPWFTP